MLNEMRTIENVVRAILREIGLKVGTPARKDFIARVRELAAGRSPAMMIEPLLAILATMQCEFAKLTKQVLVIVRDEPICRRLMTVPGVGPLTALAFRATIDQPERFGKSRDVGAHLGLTPRRYQSGETDIQGRVSRCGDELARTALYEAAHYAAHAWQEMVGLASVGHEDRQASRNVAGPGRGRAKARGHPAPHVDDEAEFRFGREPAASPTSRRERGLRRENGIE